MLATSPEVDARLGRRHKTVPELAGQLVALVRRWFPAVPIKLIGEGAYSGLTLGLTCANYHVTLIAPLRQDACLCAPAPLRQPGQNGRPRIKGKRLPKRETRCWLIRPPPGSAPPSPGTMAARKSSHGAVEPPYGIEPVSHPCRSAGS